MLSVRDEGDGIDAADADCLFEIFQRCHSTAEQSGSGIGLALCKRIVERHDGEIWVDSEPGVGSTFSFTLLACAEPENESEAASNWRTPSRRRIDSKTVAWSTGFGPVATI